MGILGEECTLKNCMNTCIIDMGAKPDLKTEVFFPVYTFTGTNCLFLTVPLMG